MRRFVDAYADEFDVTDRELYLMHCYAVSVLAHWTRMGQTVDQRIATRIALEQAAAERIKGRLGPEPRPRKPVYR